MLLLFKYTCSVTVIHKQNNVISFESFNFTSSTQTRQHKADRVVALPSGCHGAAWQLAHPYTARRSQPLSLLNLTTHQFYWLFIISRCDVLSLLQPDITGL